MKIITQLVILILSLLLVNAGRHCNYLLKRYHEFKSTCSPASITINNCCDLTAFPRHKAPSDVYKIRKCMPVCEETAPFTTVNSDAFCNMRHDYGGWIVIQRNRVDSSVDFNKNWKDYEEGFGNLEGYFWYGLKSIYCLTQNDPWEMSIVYQLKSGDWHSIFYNQFSVGNASEKYPLTIGGFRRGKDDWFVSHQQNGGKFTTSDCDNDNWSGNCAAHWKSGWWYNNCTNININAKPPHLGNLDVVFTEMMIRPKDCIVH